MVNGENNLLKLNTNYIQIKKLRKKALLLKEKLLINFILGHSVC